MSLSADDGFLVVVAHQARATYATHQLNTCRNALQHWHTYSADAVGPYDHTRVRYEVEYYTEQVKRWQEYLECLGTGAL
jgi:hypothetical protein